MTLARNARTSGLLSAFFLVLFCLVTASRADIVGFEGNSLYSQGADGKYYNGDKGTNTTNSDGWNNSGVHFSNSFTYDNEYKYSYWSGFSYSRVNAGSVSGYSNQYASKPGTGSEGSEHYAVVYNSFSGDAVVTFGAQVQLSTIDLTNTAYTYYSMKDGDEFAKKFGGSSGNDADFFKLELQGFSGTTKTGSVDFYLADYQFADNAQDYIVDKWTSVNLASLGTIDSLKFALSSSDNGQFGMNTPAYFAMDNIKFSAVPEPGSIAMIGSVAVGLWLRRRSKNRLPKERC